MGLSAAGSALSTTAPGKLMLSGEYAVLDGAPAVVAAVDARARAELRLAAADNRDAGGAPDAPPEVVATWALARERYASLPPGPPRIDVSALRDPSGAQKLGLGSSAAAAAATAALALVAADPRRALSDAAAREELFQLAFDGHRVIAPEGSGADVAAAARGGFLRFEPSAPGGAQRPTCAPLSPPADLVTRVVWTGHAARTSDLVGQVKRFEARDPAAYQALSHELGGAASAFADAFQAGRLAALLPLVERYHDAMRALGDAAGAPIVEARLTEVARLAKLAGGRAKPSGAGGGDVAIAFFSSARDAARFDLLLADAKFETLALRLGADGPRRA